MIASAIGTYRMVRLWFRYEANYWYFYPHAVNDKLILGQEEDDFLLNGYQIRRISDLRKAEIKSDLCGQISVWAGVTGGIRDPEVDLSSWQTVFCSSALCDTFVIVEDEYSEVFRLGLIRKACARYVSLYSIDANGVYEEEPFDFPYSKITSVSWGTRYAETWYRYAKAHGMLPRDDRASTMNTRNR